MIYHSIFLEHGQTREPTTFHTLMELLDIFNGYEKNQDNLESSNPQTIS